MASVHGHGSGGGLAETLEHSIIVDLLSILIYIYFGYVSYTNLGFNKSDIYSLSLDPNVIAVQLAAFLIVLNIFFMLHDKVSFKK